MHIAKTTAVSLISVLNPTLITQSSEECWALSFVQDCWIRLHLFLTGWKTFKLKKNQTHNGRNNFGEVKIYILPVKLMHAGLNLFNHKTNPYTQCLFKSTTTLCAGCNKLGEKTGNTKHLQLTIRKSIIISSIVMRSSWREVLSGREISEEQPALLELLPPTVGNKASRTQ